MWLRITSIYSFFWSNCTRFYIFLGFSKKNIIHKTKCATKIHNNLQKNTFCLKNVFVVCVSFLIHLAGILCVHKIRIGASVLYDNVLVMYPWKLNCAQ